MDGPARDGARVLFEPYACAVLAQAGLGVAAEQHGCAVAAQGAVYLPADLTSVRVLQDNLSI